MTDTVLAAPRSSSAFFSLHWGNWRLALLVALLVFVVTIPLAPPAVSFWACAGY